MERQRGLDDRGEATMTDPTGVPDVRGMTPARDLRDAIVKAWAYTTGQEHELAVDLDALIEAAKRGERYTAAEVVRMLEGIKRSIEVMGEDGECSLRIIRGAQYVTKDDAMHAVDDRLGVVRLRARAESEAPEAWGSHTYRASSEFDPRCGWTNGMWSACKAPPEAKCHTPEPPAPERCAWTDGTAVCGRDRGAAVHSSFGRDRHPFEAAS
jgi:hypothetical protein